MYHTTYLEEVMSCLRYLAAFQLQCIRIQVQDMKMLNFSSSLKVSKAVCTLLKYLPLCVKLFKLLSLTYFEVYLFYHSLKSVSGKALKLSIYTCNKYMHVFFMETSNL